MWCTKCGEGVPTLATESDPNVCVCVNCKQTYYVDTANKSPGVPFLFTKTGGDGISAPRSRPDVDRFPGLELNTSVVSPVESEDHHPLPAPHFPIRSTAAPKRRNETTSSTLLWLTLLVGVMVFTCGAALIGFSLIGERPNLWRFGTPIALLGQLILFSGIALQLDVVNFHQRTSARKLHLVSNQISGRASDTESRQPKQSKLPRLFSETVERESLIQ